MIANYHTHTHRCNHAIGREEDYVREALKAGLEILGWADHTPYTFTGGYYSHFRMRPIQLPGYIQTIQELQEMDHKTILTEFAKSAKFEFTKEFDEMFDIVYKIVTDPDYENK